MSDFITFQNSGNEYGYFFNWNHAFLLLGSMILVIFFTLYYERQSRTAQRIFVGIITFILVALEVARIYWRYRYLEYNGQYLSFLSVTGLDFFTLSLWLSIPLLIIGVIVIGKRDYAFGLSFIFAVGSLASVVTTIYPVGLNTNFSVVHCYNLIWFLEHSFLCMLGFILAISRWVAARDFLDLWGGVLSLLFFGGVCIGLNYLFGWENNLFYVASCPLFESLGIYLPFPVHFILLGAFLFVFQIIIYLPFRLFENWRNKAIVNGTYHN